MHQMNHPRTLNPPLVRGFETLPDLRNNPTQDGAWRCLDPDVVPLGGPESDPRHVVDLRGLPDRLVSCIIDSLDETVFSVVSNAAGSL